MFFSNFVLQFCFYNNNLYFYSHRSKYIPPRTYSRANTSLATRTPKAIIGLPVAEVKPEIKVPEPTVIEENGTNEFSNKFEIFYCN